MGLKEDIMAELRAKASQKSQTFDTSLAGKNRSNLKEEIMNELKAKAAYKSAETYPIEEPMSIAPEPPKETPIEIPKPETPPTIDYSKLSEAEQQSIIDEITQKAMGGTKQEVLYGVTPRQIKTAGKALGTAIDMGWALTSPLTYGLYKGLQEAKAGAGTVKEALKESIDAGFEGGIKEGAKTFVKKGFIPLAEEIATAPFRALPGVVEGLEAVKETKGEPVIKGKKIVEYEPPKVAEAFEYAHEPSYAGLLPEDKRTYGHIADIVVDLPILIRSEIKEMAKKGMKRYVDELAQEAKLTDMAKRNKMLREMEEQKAALEAAKKEAPEVEAITKEAAESVKPIEEPKQLELKPVETKIKETPKVEEIKTEIKAEVEPVKVEPAKVDEIKPIKAEKIKAPEIKPDDIDEIKAIKQDKDVLDVKIISEEGIKPEELKVKYEPAVKLEVLEKKPQLYEYVLKREKIHAPEVVEYAKQIAKEPDKYIIKPLTNESGHANLEILNNIFGVYGVARKEPDKTILNPLIDAMYKKSPTVNLLLNPHPTSVISKEAAAELQMFRATADFQGLDRIMIRAKKTLKPEEYKELENAAFKMPFTRTETERKMLSVWGLDGAKDPYIVIKKLEDIILSDSSMIYRELVTLKSGKQAIVTKRLLSKPSYRYEFEQILNKHKFFDNYVIDEELGVINKATGNIVPIETLPFDVQKAIKEFRIYTHREYAEYFKLSDMLTNGTNYTIDLHALRRRAKDKIEDLNFVEDFAFNFLNTIAKQQGIIARAKLLAKLANTPNVAVATEEEALNLVKQKIWTKAVQMPYGKKYGALSGLWVDRTLAQELGMYDIIEELGTVGYAIKKLESGAAVFNKMWAYLKVVGNFSAANRDFMSNLYTMWLAGWNPYDPKVWKETFAILSGKHHLSDWFFTQTKGTTLANRELWTTIDDEIKAMLNVEETPETVRQKVFAVISKPFKFYFGKLQEYRAFNDTFGKATLFAQAIEQGLTKEQALRYAEYWVYSGQDIPRAVMLFKNTTHPFIGYTYFAMTRIPTALLQNPIRTSLTIWASANLPYVGNLIEDITLDEEEKKIAEFMREEIRAKRALGRAKWLNPNLLITLGVDPEEKKAIKFINVSNLFAIGNVIDGYASMGIQTPLINVPYILMSEKSPYSGVEYGKLMLTEYLDPNDRNGYYARLKDVLLTIFPSTFTLPYELYQAAKGEKIDIRTGAEKSPLDVLVKQGGINVYRYNYPEQMLKDVKYYEFITSDRVLQEAMNAYERKFGKNTEMYKKKIEELLNAYKYNLEEYSKILKDLGIKYKEVKR